MLLTLEATLSSGHRRHNQRLTVPAGHVVSIFNAVPEHVGEALASGAAFDAQAAEVAAQFARFREAQGFSAGECRTLTLFVRNAEDVEEANALARSLCSGQRTIIVDRLDQPGWRVLLNACFVRCARPATVD